MGIADLDDYARKTTIDDILAGLDDDRRGKLERALREPRRVAHTDLARHLKDDGYDVSVYQVRRWRERNVD